MTDTQELIVRALRNGPLYEGALEGIVDRPDFRRALRALQDRGAIKRDMPDNPYTWKLADD